jgi:hypothetical protein
LRGMIVDGNLLIDRLGVQGVIGVLGTATS